MVCCLLLGGTLGALIVFAEGDWTAVFTQGLRHALSVSAPWLLTVTALVSTLSYSFKAMQLGKRKKEH